MQLTRQGAARLLLVAAALLATSAAAAEEPQVSFSAGRVTISARDAPLGALLDAWERQAGVRFVTAGRLPDLPVSVELVDVSEREALDVLLRPLAGYVALPRARAEAHTSAYDRVFIMAGVAPSRAARRPPETAPATADNDNLLLADPWDGALPAVDLEELDEMDELALVESLRQRYEPAAPAVGAEGPFFNSQPDGAPLGATPRPGMVIDTEAPRDGPRPARRRGPAR